MKPYLLFVDDQPMLGTLMEMSFSEAGINTKLATSANVALDLIKQDKNHSIKVLFTDIHLPPGNSGWWLIEEVKKIRDNIKYMVISADMDSREKGKNMVITGDLYAYFEKSGGVNQDIIMTQCKKAMSE